MRYYLAPMEGITGAIFRNAHYAMFGGADRYYAPFVGLGHNSEFTARGAKDLRPERNYGVPVVPQLLTNSARDFLFAANVLKDMGYTEVNLNLGCPSGTVVSKGKGAGFLARPDELDAFLEEVFASCPLPVSVKTRIGMTDVAEAERLFGIYRRYPIYELTVHPRLRAQKYAGHPHIDVFDTFTKDLPFPVCYNGDLFTANAVRAFVAERPWVSAVMLGRGLVANPALAREAASGEKLTIPELRAFYDRLTADYLEAMPGEKTMLFHIKELCLYMVNLFPDAQKHAKRIRKAVTLNDFNTAVDRLFSERELDPNGGFDSDSLNRNGGI